MGPKRGQGEARRGKEGKMSNFDPHFFRVCRGPIAHLSTPKRCGGSSLAIWGYMGYSAGSYQRKIDVCMYEYRFQMRKPYKSYMPYSKKRDYV